MPLKRAAFQYRRSARAVIFTRPASLGANLETVLATLFVLLGMFAASHNISCDPYVWNRTVTLPYVNLLVLLSKRFVFARVCTSRSPLPSWPSRIRLPLSRSDAER